MGDCPTCKAFEAEFPLRNDDAKTNLEFRRRRREMLHVRFCMTTEQRRDWLLAKIAARRGDQ